MQTAGPYRLQRSLSTCDVGEVWSGVDDQGRSVTVAVLNGRASADERWRGAFAAAAEALGEAGADQLPIVGSDHDAGRPWVACAVERGPGAAQIFLALGRQMEPVVPAPVARPAAAPVSGTPTSGGAHPPVSAAPTSGGAHPSVPVEPVAAVDQTTVSLPSAGHGTHGWSPATGSPATGAPVVGWPETGSPATGSPATGSPATGSPVAPRPADPTPASGVHPASPGPWELPPTAGRPAEPSDHRTQLVPLVPVQQARPPDATPAQSVVPHPGPYYPAPVPAEGTAAGYRNEPVDYAPSSPAYDYPEPRDHPGRRDADEHFGPVSAPRSDRGAGMPVSADPFSPVSGSPQNWQRSRVFGDPPPKPKRNLLLLGCVALVALLLGAGAGVAVTAARGGADPAASPTQDTPLTPAQLLLPPTPPEAPGVEPPQGGGWPESWPVFTSSESTKPMTGLQGLGFDFRVPPGWSCTKQAQAEAAVRYRCGTGEGADAVGGDLLVRSCQPPCDEPRRTELRRQEEAWGLGWIRSGPFVTWAETNQVNGERRYGLVYVAFWRSTREGRIDRQLAFRMSAPPAAGNDLKKVANSIRASTFTL